MTDSNFIIVSVMGRGNLHSSGTEFHVDNNGVRDNWYSAVNERMDCKFSVKVLQIVLINDMQRSPWTLTVYLGSSGWTAIAVSPSIVSGRVVAMMIFSSVKEHKWKIFYSAKAYT